MAVVLIVWGSACGHTSNHYLESGNKLAFKGKYEDAALNYRKAIQRDPNNGEAYYQLGLTSIRLRRRGDAFQALSRATDLLPNRADVRVKAADFALDSYLADRRHPRVLYDKAKALADQFLGNDIGSFDGLRLRGRLAQADRNLKDAIEFYRRANVAKPMQPEVVTAWAEALLEDGQPTEAETLALELIRKNKTALGAYEVLYRYYSKANRAAEAENVLKSRAENNPADVPSALGLAAFYAAHSRETEMKGVLQGMVDHPQTFPNARVEVGDFYAGLQRWTEALENYDAGVRADPKHKVAYLKKTADVWLIQGNRDRASQVVEQIIRAAPEDDGAKAVGAALLVSTGKPENIAKGVSTLEALVDKNPEQPDWHLKLAGALEAKGDLNNARAQFLEAIRRSPNSLPPRIALAQLTQALGDYKATLQYADEILQLAPKLTSAKVLRAASLMHLGFDAQARTELAVLDKASPGDTEVQLQLAAMDLHDKKFRDAEARFRTLLQTRPGDGRPLAGLVETLVADQRPDQAILLLQDLLKRAPNAIAVRGLLARTAVQSGKFDLAIEQYRQVLSASPNSPQADIDLGNVFQLKGDYPSAVSYFQKAIALAPNTALPRALLGGVLSESGRKPEALENFRHALKLEPENSTFLNDVAFLIADTGGDLDEALKLVQKARQSDVNQPHYLDTLGWIYCKKRLNDSALQVYRNLTAKFPDNATFHYHFALALSQQGDTAAARAELKTALSKNATDELRHSIETALAKIG